MDEARHLEYGNHERTVAFKYTSMVNSPLPLVNVAELFTNLPQKLFLPANVGMAVSSYHSIKVHCTERDGVHGALRYYLLAVLIAWNPWILLNVRFQNATQVLQMVQFDTMTTWFACMVIRCIDLLSFHTSSQSLMSSTATIHLCMDRTGLQCR